MKKFFSKLICLILSLAFCVSLVACKTNENDNQNNEVAKNTHADFDSFESRFGEYVDDTPNVANVYETETVFYDVNSANVSDYKILISTNDYSCDAELRAANEIQFFVNDLIGFKLPIVKDNDPEFVSANVNAESEFSYDTNKKYISIGYTNVFYANKNAFGENFNFDYFGNDGFMIKTIDNTVIINAIGNNGIVYSAYEFLEHMLGFEYYADDVWTYSVSAVKRNLLNMDIYERPEFEARNLDSSPVLSGNLDYVTRLRFHGGQGGNKGAGMESSGWLLGDTSMCSQILDYKVYLPEHPEWYNGDGYDHGQLCFTTLLKNEMNNGLRPFDEFVVNLIKFIIGSPYSRIFMLGINDNASYFCSCQDCIDETLEIDYSGQMCLVANAVSDAVIKWQNGSTTLPSGDELPIELLVDNNNKQHNSTRDIKIAFFAYQKCINAPVLFDATIGQYVPIRYDAPYKVLGGDGTSGDGDDNDLVLRDNIVLRVAATETSWMRVTYNTEFNNVAYSAQTQWQALASHMSIWDYGTNFKDYLSYFPDLYTIQDNFKFYRYCNVSEILTQLPAHTAGTSFFALKIYLRAKLMWDMDQDVSTLVDNYLKAYYGPKAYPAIKEYLEFITNYYYMMDADNPYVNEQGNLIDADGYVNSNGKRIEFHAPYYDNYISDNEHFPMPTVIKLRGMVDKVQELVLSDPNDPMFEVYLKHAQTESLWSRYMQLNSFGSYYNVEERTVLINDFEKYALQAKLKEHNHACKGANAGQIARIIKNWRAGLN